VFDSKHKTKLSSAGLIYKHFGKEVIAKLTGGSEAEVNLIWLKIYDNFIEGKVVSVAGSAKHAIQPLAC
jgi:uncharacterized UPF0160 family protein